MNKLFPVIVIFIFALYGCGSSFNAPFSYEEVSLLLDEESSETEYLLYLNILNCSDSTIIEMRFHFDIVDDQEISLCPFPSNQFEGYMEKTVPGNRSIEFIIPLSSYLPGFDWANSFTVYDIHLYSLTYGDLSEWTDYLSFHPYPDSLNSGDAANEL